MYIENVEVRAIYASTLCRMRIENLNQNKCSTLRVEQGRNGSRCLTSSRAYVNKHRLYGPLLLLLYAHAKEYKSLLQLIKNYQERFHVAIVKGLKKLSIPSSEKGCVIIQKSKLEKD